MVRPAHSSPSDALPRGKPDLCEPLERPSWCSKPAVLFNAARFYQISIALQLSELKRLHTYKLNHANTHTAGHSAHGENRRPKAGIPPGRLPPANPCCRTDKHSIDGAKPESSAFCSAQIIVSTICSNICAPQRGCKLRAKEIEWLQVRSTLNLCWNPSAPGPFPQGLCLLLPLRAGEDLHEVQLCRSHGFRPFVL